MRARSTRRLALELAVSGEIGLPQTRAGLHAQWRRSRPRLLANEEPIRLRGNRVRQPVAQNDLVAFPRLQHKFATEHRRVAFAAVGLGAFQTLGSHHSLPAGA